MLQVTINDQQIQGRTSYITLPDINLKESMGDTTPNVSNINFLAFINSAPLTITNLIGGIDGRVLYILGDGQTSLDHNITIKTSTGAPKLLGLHIYILVQYKNIWYEIN